LDQFVDIVMVRDPVKFTRPVGLAELGSDSAFAEPYVIRSPHRVHVGRNVRVEENVFLSVVEDHEGVKFDPILRIGDDTVISSDLRLHCTGGIDIGKRVAIAARVYIGDSFRDYGDPYVAPRDMPIAEPIPIRIGDGAFIGTGSTILPGATIGDRAIVAAGSVVTRDIPARTVAFGNPARVVRSWDERSQQWVAGPLRRSA
jgi:acetyltransferase-like isoleucine patch superfamily enzyme